MTGQERKFQNLSGPKWKKAMHLVAHDQRSETWRYDQDVLSKNNILLKDEIKMLHRSSKDCTICTKCVKCLMFLVKLIKIMQTADPFSACSW